MRQSAQGLGGGLNIHIGRGGGLLRQGLWKRDGGHQIQVEEIISDGILDAITDATTDIGSKHIIQPILAGAMHIQIEPFNDALTIRHLKAGLYSL